MKTFKNSIRSGAFLRFVAASASFATTSIRGAGL